jgi:hypothetical protein
MNDIAIKTAENALECFLDDNPHMQEFQEELNAEMERMAVDSTSRMHIIAHKMRWNLHRLERIGKELEPILEKIKCLKLEKK